MTFRPAFFASVSVVAIIASAPAMAQTDATGAATQTETVAAQQKPAEPAPGEIIVTGYRASIQSATAIKRNSIQVVDAVVAADIGKLPDVTVSDTAARIPGIQVSRFGDEADTVYLRGLDDTFITSTYNGRDIFTTIERRVKLHDFPASALQSLEVYKTSTADLPEAGLAGEIDVRSRKPFDFSGLEIAGSLQGSYAARNRKFDPNASLLLSDRWNTGIGEIGVLLNASYTRLRYQDAYRGNNGFIQNYAPGGINIFPFQRFPDMQQIRYDEAERTRPAINGALQWRPHPGLEFYADALWQGYRNEGSSRLLNIPNWGGTYTDAKIDPATGLVSSLTAVNERRPEGFQESSHGRTDTYQYSIGGKYDGDHIHISGNAAHTVSQFELNQSNVDVAVSTASNPTTITTTYANGTYFNFPNNPKFTNDKDWVFRGFYDNHFLGHGQDWQGRLDFVLDVDDSIIKKIQWGGRYVNHDAVQRAGDRYSNTNANGVSYESLQIPLSALNVGASDFRSVIPGDDPTTIRGYYTPSYSGIRSQVTALRNFVGFAAGNPPDKPLNSFNVNEQSYAFYGQAQYGFNIAGLPVDGVVGLRILNSILSVSSGDVIQGGPLNTVTSGRGNSLEFLPNASVDLHLTDKVQLRLSYDRTVSRPSYYLYAPGRNVGQPLTADQIAAGLRRGASQGNPNLNAYSGKNYDVSLEYYLSKSTSVAVAGFYKDVLGFIQQYTTNVDDPILGPLSLTKPYNSGKGTIKGAEAQLTTFLDADMFPQWIHPFGVQANVTYIDAKVGTPAALGGVVTENPITGISHWSYNVAGIYEHAGLSVRLTYNRRSSYVSTLGDRGPTTIYRETTGPVSRLDLSANYDVLKNVTLTADATNLLGVPTRATLTQTLANGVAPLTYPLFTKYDETVYSLGLRFRF